MVYLLSAAALIVVIGVLSARRNPEPARQPVRIDSDRQRKH